MCLLHLIPFSISVIGTKVSHAILCTFTVLSFIPFTQFMISKQKIYILFKKVKYTFNNTLLIISHSLKHGNVNDYNKESWLDYVTHYKNKEKMIHFRDAYIIHFRDV